MFMYYVYVIQIFIPNDKSSEFFKINFPWNKELLKLYWAQLNLTYKSQRALASCF